MAIKDNAKPPFIPSMPVMEGIKINTYRRNGKAQKYKCSLSLPVFWFYRKVFGLLALKIAIPALILIIYFFYGLFFLKFSVIPKQVFKTGIHFSFLKTVFKLLVLLKSDIKSVNPPCH